MEVLQVRSELAQACALYEELAPKHVLEIGCYQGGTLKEWLTRGEPEMVVAVDLEHPSYHLYGTWLQAGTHLRVITGYSQDRDVGEQISEVGPYDWAFIDGDHSDHAVRSDMALVLPLMNPGGRLVFHDLRGERGIHEHQYAPGMVVDELERAGYQVERFIAPDFGDTAHGIGVVTIPDDV